MIDDMLQQQSSYMEDQPLSDTELRDWHADLCIRYNFAQVRMHKSKGHGKNYGVFLNAEKSSFPSLYDITEVELLHSL